MARQYEGKVKVIGMAGFDGTEAMRGFVQRHELGSIPHTADVDGSLWPRLGVRSQPSWIFVNGADGETTREFGELDSGVLKARLDDLVAR